MKNFTLLLCLATLGAWSTTASSQTIDLRISVHVILNPVTGERPPGITNEVFYIAETNANAIMAGYFRGYRYRITEITNVGGPMNGGYNGPSKWFGRGLSDKDDTNVWAEFQSNAATNNLYRLRPDQINVYVSQGYAAPGGSGGATPIPPNNLATAVEIYPDNGSFWLLHEMGHFFGLYHTFAGESFLTASGQPCTNGCACAQRIPGNADGISDTLPDSSCWKSPDDVAQYYFNTNYNSLDSGQASLVDEIYFNVMAYHNHTNEVRLTEMQLDIEADHASGDRNAFVSGKSYFVSTDGWLLGTGGSWSPVRFLSQGVSLASAAGGDIILLRPGSYNEQLTINKPVTLRAPRTGWVTIGK